MTRKLSTLKCRDPGNKVRHVANVGKDVARTGA
jgi:hypothetical protein